MGEREPYAGVATTFDTAAELYERARPGYPERLFADLAETAGLVTGAGTGQRGAPRACRLW
ncbi:hypothetical protein ACLQ2S_21305 [Micromonospora sp. DT48]|uniref:hypothetical protein n=1 Tax=Micromonospora sp. DT48 TaxID=3393429 RepID=UPI003CFB1445